MDDKVSCGEALVPQSGYVVVLNVIPLDVKEIEDIRGDEPFTRSLVAKLQIDS